MKRRAPRRPSLRVLLIAALVLGLPGAAYAHSWTARTAVEHRAAAVASSLTHRTIRVACPGPIKRRLFYEIHEGEVRFDADGVPADATKLSARTCDGLRDAAHHGATYTFSCLAGGYCAAPEERVAEALAVLTHEIMHLRGTRDEAVAECQARGRVAGVAATYGVAPDAARRVAVWQATVWQARLPSQYQDGRC